MDYFACVPGKSHNHYGTDGSHGSLAETYTNSATEQYCAAGATLCLSKQLTLCSQQHIDQLFSGHIV